METHLKYEKLTVKEFAELSGIRPQTIRIQLNRGASYPSILKVGRSKFGNQYELTVLKSWVDSQKEYSFYMNGKNQQK